MPRTFAYLRVSTASQSTASQPQEIEAAGFAIMARRLIAETISGSVAVSPRPGFVRLLGQGASIATLARMFTTSRQTILRLRDAGVGTEVEDAPSHVGAGITT